MMRLAGPDLHRRDKVGAVAALRGGLDGREILVVVVTVTKEEERLQPGPLLQVQTVSAEELSGNADKANPPGEHRRCQPGTNAVLVLPLVKGDQFGKEGGAEGQMSERVGQVEARTEGQLFLAADQGILLERLAADGPDQGQGLASQRGAEALRIASPLRVGRQVAGRSLQKQAGGLRFLLDQAGQDAGIVG